MTTMPGTVPQIFQFSVRNDATVRKIEETAGRRTALTYEQHKGVPNSYFGETDYFIIWFGQSVSSLDEPYITSGVALPGPREFPYPKAILGKDKPRTPTENSHSDVLKCTPLW
jgi:hypothetical protein